MFYEWVSDGAIWGVKVFSMIFTFLMCCAGIILVTGIMGAILKLVFGEDDNANNRPRSL